MNSVDDYEQIEAYLIEQSRSRWVQNALISILMVLVGVALIEIGAVVGGIIGAIGGLACYSVSMLKVSVIDGNEKARAIGSWIPHWKNPVERKDSVIEIMIAKGRNE